MAVDLHVYETGSGVPLVLVHAFPVHAGMWDGVRDRIGEVCRVLTPDLRGFGRSPLGDDEPSLDRYADDMAALLDRRGIDRAVIGGASMGGYVTMAFLRRYPDRVRGIVLVDTKAGADPEAARANRERIAAMILAERTPRVLLDDVLPGLLGETTRQSRPEVVEQVRALVAEARPEAAAFAQRAMALRPDSFDTLRDADVPALVLVGEEDRLAPPEEAEAMAKALPNARLVTVPGAGHLPPVENPEEFTRAVTAFMSGI